MDRFVDSTEQLVTEIFVADIHRSAAFYRQLGFQLPRDGGDFMELTWEDHRLFLAALSALRDADADERRLQLRKFSKGMLQRVGIAQALINDPELVIFDEPMSGLDPIGRREVRDLILAQRAAGRTVFFSSHILQDAEMLCDRVAIVFRGKLRSVGRLDDLVSRDAKWIEVSVRGRVPDGLAGERTVAPDGTTLVKVDGVPALTKLLAAVPAAGGEVVSVWPRRESLEDLFLREIGRAAAEERAS
jgi:ABC-2 type transport system ATP-binding protein